MKSTLLAVIFLSTGLEGLSFAQSPDCSAVLPPGGAFSIVVAGGASRQTTSAKEWFCSDSFESSQNANSAGGSLSIPIPGVPIGTSFDSHNQSHVQARQRFCSDDSREFSSQQQNYLVVKAGDPTLIKGFLECMRSRSDRFLQVSSISRTSGAFDVKVSARPYPGNDPPILVDAKVLAGAEPVDMDDFNTGARIPFDNSGVEPLTGTYAFKEGVPTADIRIRTSIGSSTITARRCSAGSAGTWAVESTVQRSSQTAPTPVGVSYVIPQGSCHPHCKNSDPGTPLDYYLEAPSGSRLLNGKWVCEGNGCQFGAIIGPTPLAPNRLLVHVQSRSEQSTLTITADRVDPIETTGREMLSHGSMEFDQPFSIDVPSSGDPRVAIATKMGKLNLSLATTLPGQLPDWLKVSPPSQGGGAVATYTLTVAEPWCSAH